MGKRYFYALLLMGFTSLVVQVLLIREFLTCFYGNELSIGIILGNWIILEAIGSGLASKKSHTSQKPLLHYALYQALIALYLPFSIYLIRSAKDFFPLATGEAMGIIPVFVVSFITLAPISILDGAQFPFGCRIWKDHTQKHIESIGAVYVFEALGFIIAGPIFTYVFMTHFPAVDIAVIVSILNLFSAFLLFKKDPISQRATVFFPVAFACIASTTLLFFNSTHIEQSSLKRQWKNYTLVDHQNSPYGNIAVTRQTEQYTFFSDGIPIITSPVPDINENEEFIHFGMLAHPAPRTILIVAGGAGGRIAEIVKHPVQSVDYAELDPLLIRLVKRYPTELTKAELANPLVSIKINDGARYIKTTANRYDVIFINVPFPTTFQFNRFYTKDFFDATKNAFKDTRGILVLKLPGSLSYLNQELRQLNRCIADTLRSSFASVRIIPGDTSTLYLASQTTITIDPALFSTRLKERSIQSPVLTDFYLAQRLDPNLQQWLSSELKQAPKTTINTTIMPIGLFFGLSYWNTVFAPYLKNFFTLIGKIEFSGLQTMLIVICCFVLLASLVIPRCKKIAIPYSALTTGITGMAISMMIIFSYQALYGYVYYHIALLLTAFMAGLTLGGWLITHTLSKLRNKKFTFLIIEYSLAIFPLALIAMIAAFGNTKAEVAWAFFTLSACIGFLVGMEFPLANFLYQFKETTHSAGILYALDLAGSWMGALVVSVILIPVVGLIWTCLFLTLLKLTSLVLITFLRSG